MDLSVNTGFKDAAVPVDAPPGCTVLPPGIEFILPQRWQHETVLSLILGLPPPPFVCSPPKSGLPPKGGPPPKEPKHPKRNPPVRSDLPSKKRPKTPSHALDNAPQNPPPAPASNPPLSKPQDSTSVTSTKIRIRVLPQVYM